MAVTKQTILLPALRGEFGDWVYYSCLMPLPLIADLVGYAAELYPKNPGLQDFMQRALDHGRAKDIALYLQQSQRFFNSLVVALHKGQPTWHEIASIKPRSSTVDLDDIPREVRHRSGFLGLTKGERLFAVDGQHRLAGIKRALSDGKLNERDSVSVLMVPHSTSAAGMRRTRQLFTTLNKTAVRVKPRDIIALDEDDVMAICVRRLVTEDRRFERTRIAYNSTSNLRESDTACLTSLVNLYDILGTLFAEPVGRHKKNELRFNRLSNVEIESYYKLAVEYFDHLQTCFPAVRNYFRFKGENDYRRAAQRYRSKSGGQLLFRPIGLRAVTEAVAHLVKSGCSLEESVRYVSWLPTQLDSIPFQGVLWDTARSSVITSGRALSVKLMRYMLGILPEKHVVSLRKDYSIAIDSSNRSDVLVDVPIVLEWN